MTIYTHTMGHDLCDHDMFIHIDIYALFHIIHFISVRCTHRTFSAITGLESTHIYRDHVPVTDNISTLVGDLSSQWWKSEPVNQGYPCIVTHHHDLWVVNIPIPSHCNFRISGIIAASWLCAMTFPKFAANFVKKHQRGTNEDIRSYHALVDQRCSEDRQAEGKFMSSGGANMWLRVPSATP